MERVWRNERGIFLSGETRSKTTREIYEYNLRQFEAWCQAYGYEPLAIEPAQVFEYGRHLSTRHKATTVSNEIGTLRRFFKFLVRRGIIDRNPAEEVVWATTDVLIHEIPGVDDLRRLWDSCVDDDERTAIGLLGICGMKPREVQDAQLQDLSTVDGQDLLRIPSRKAGHLRPYVPLCEPLSDVTMRLRDQRGTGPLVRSRYGNKLDRHSLRKLTRRVSARAGLSYTLNPIPLSYSLRAAAIERGHAYAEIIRAIGEMDPRRLSVWVERAPATADEHPALRLGRLVLGSGSDTEHHLHHAEQILRTTDAHPAAAVGHAGAIVERHLRGLMNERAMTAPSNPKLSAYGAALKAAEVIDNRALQLLNRMQDIRNAAAHGRFESITSDDASWFLDNACALLEAHPVQEAIAPPG